MASFWSRLHITSGAAFFILVSLLFTAAVFKIDHNANDKASAFQKSVCTFVAQANTNVGSQRARVVHAEREAQKRATAEEHIASVWQYALRTEPRSTPSTERNLVIKIIHAQETLAQQDRIDVSTYHHELNGIRPIRLSGC